MNSGFELRAGQHTTSTGEHVVLWAKPTDFGEAVISAAVFTYAVPGQRMNGVRVQFGLFDSVLAPIFDRDHEEFSKFVGQFGSSLQHVKRGPARTAVSRNSRGLEAGLYDATTMESLETSLDEMSKDLEAHVLPFFEKFPTRRSVYVYLLNCEKRGVDPYPFENIDGKLLALEAMYGDATGAIDRMRARQRSLRRWRKVYQLIGLDRMKSEPESIARYERMIRFAREAQSATNT
jgi:hypothetical protein